MDRADEQHFLSTLYFCQESGMDVSDDLLQGVLCLCLFNPNEVHVVTQFIQAQFGICPIVLVDKSLH